MRRLRFDLLAELLLGSFFSFLVLKKNYVGEVARRTEGTVLEMYFSDEYSLGFD